LISFAHCRYFYCEKKNLPPPSPYPSPLKGEGTIR
jgi:hypothetical protein